MATHAASRWHTCLLGLSTLFLIITAAPASAQGKDNAVDVTGEASIVIFDDIVNNRSETRYFIIDKARGLERKLVFPAGAPAGFQTGRQFRVRGQGRADGIHVESLTAMADGDESGGETAEAPVAGEETRTVLTILVDFNDATVDGASMNYGVSLQEAKDTMFNRTKNVAGLYFNASLGTFMIAEDPDGDGNQDVFGPYQINDEYLGTSSDCTPSTWVSLARQAWEAANPGRSYDEYQHTSLIVPNYWDYGGRACGWGGVAQLGCGTTCWAINADPDSILHGVIVHELGHNFGLHHASTDTDNNGTIDSEYGDNSDMMGGSRNWKKFNAPHTEDKSWIDPVNYEIRTVVPSASAQNFDLLPMDEETWDWPGLRTLKVERTSSSDYYISYRIAGGDYNNLNSGYQNELSIHYGTDNSTRSYYVTGLAAGQTYNDPHNNLIIEATGEITVDDGLGNTTTVMGVQICQDTCSSIPAPSNLTATATGIDAIDLAWTDNSDSEDGFTLEHSPDGNSWTVLADNLVTTSYSHTGLATASTHHYRVRAFNFDEVSGWSNEAVETTDAIPPTANFSWSADYLDVSFTDLSSDSDGLVSTWDWDFGDGNSSGAQNPSHGYAVGGDYTVTLTVTDNHGATDSFSDTVTVEAPPWSDHFAQSETDGGGSVTGNYTRTFADDGSAEAVTEEESNGKPNRRHTWLEHQWTFNIPTGAQATLMANAWQDDTGENDHFEFAYSTNGNSWTPMFTVDTTDSATSHSFVLAGGTAGTVYVRVTDTDQSQGNRAPDTVYIDRLMIRVENASGDAPDGDPTGLSATAIGHDQIDLSWTDTSSNESGFRIERRPDGSTGWQAVGSTGMNVEAFSDTGLNPETTYHYRVLAFNLMGDSLASNSDSATTGTAPPPPDIDLFASAGKTKGRHEVTLTWTPAETAMDVYFNGGGSPFAEGVGSGWVHKTGNKGSATYTYQVCGAGGTDSCSAVVTVTY